MSFGFLSAWLKVKEDPGDQIAAANRAFTSSRVQLDKAGFDYQRALATGNSANIKAAKQAFRQAYEKDVRLRGGKPEDYIPSYPHYDPVPVSPLPFFGYDGVKSNTINIALIGLLVFFLIRN